MVRRGRPRGHGAVTSWGVRRDDDHEAIVFPGPDEIEGFWALDKMHAPRPVTPLSFDLVIHTLAEGFTKAQAEYDCPIMVTNKEVNHYMYAAFHPVPDEAVIADRMTRYHDMLAAMVPGVGRTWDEQWKPDVTGQERGAEDGRLVGPQRRRAGGQARRAHRPHALPVVHPRAHQLRAAVEQRLLRPLRQGRPAHRVRPSRTRPSRASTPARSTPAGACGT